MLIVLSPAKSLDFESRPTTKKFTLPDFTTDSAELIDLLRQFSPAQVGSLMHISDPLAQLNVARYATWSSQYSWTNAKQAVLSFNGDVYGGLDATSFNARQLDYAQNHIRILSGLYGLLRPLDLMQPYRLEMGTRLSNARGKDLYSFWGNTQTDALNALAAEQKSNVLVNLASEEYFKAVKPTSFNGKVVTPIFEDWKNGEYKIISFYAKRARGLMARYAVLNKIKNVQKLKAFNLDGYVFVPDESDAQSWRFQRRVA
ncbi:MAG: peroxide stress protein YaaA [Pseudomonadota bacterium]